jgi:Lrp/AsnC family transcriptional regulator, leucine-responsive regulatory protein
MPISSLPATLGGRIFEIHTIIGKPFRGIEKRTKVDIVLDLLDHKILAHLQANGRLTNQQLAEDVGMSSSACWRRVKHLEEAGIIRGYAALVDRRKAGFSISAIVHVLLARHETVDVEPFEERILRQPEVLECVATSGEADYHLRVVARDIEAYHQFLNGVMFKMPGVSHVRSHIVLKEIKSEVALPLVR